MRQGSKAKKEKEEGKEGGSSEAAGILGSWEVCWAKAGDLDKGN